LLPILPILVFAIEFIFCLFFGMMIFGDTMMHRLGELTVCFLIWLTSARIGAVLFSFLFAFQHPSVDQQQSLIAWIRTFLYEVLATFFAFTLLIPLSFLFAPKMSSRVKRDVPVIVLVHGLVSNSGVWWLFGRRLKRLLALQSWDVQIDSLNLGKPFESLDVYVEKLDRHLNQIRLVTDEPIVLVGHSMGGLVCRAWLGLHPECEVSALITLGTPHQGSKTANLFALPNLIQMRPDSHWLRGLLSQSSVPSTAIFSLHDNLVVPFENGQIKFFDSVPLKGLGHLSLLFDSKVIKRVAERVVSGRAAVLNKVPA
jgi:triacylglycerol lipase